MYRTAATLPALLLAAVALVLGCSEAGEPAGSRDAARPPPLPTEALAHRARVVSLSPAGTRLVARLGGLDRLVGVDAASADLPIWTPVVPSPPVTHLAASAALAPDLVLVRALPRADDPAAAGLAALGASLVEVAPHDLEDVWELFRTIGRPLVGEATALSREVEHARPLALVGGEAPAGPRPRALALVGLDPLVLAGGHSFETDLIEIGGGTSLTHGAEDHRRPTSREAIAAEAPDLILVITPEAVTGERRRALEQQLGPIAPLEYLELDTSRFWLDDPVPAVRRVQRTLSLYRR